MDVYPETFSVAAMLREVVATADALMAQNSNTLTTKVDLELGAMYTDLTKVRQSLFNLLSNAAKFTRNGSVTLEASAEPDWLRFTVADTGIGIEADAIERLFQPFMQLDRSTFRQFGGTGLGLALTRRFCEMLGGEISVESTPGEGSRFTVRLPRKAPDAVALPEAIPLEARDGRSTVLVIDDDATARDLMQRYLTREGFRAVLAASGEEGLRLARTEHPRVITLDVMMPGMDGWSVLQALKSDPELRSIPVIMATIVADRGLGYALGAADYLIKPFNREKLVEILNRYDCEPHPCQVLLVDDDEAAREIVKAMLEKEGWRVVCAADGLEAIAEIEKQAPHLILLDLLMPNMDGFEFALHMRQRPDLRHIPVIVLTAKDLTAEDRIRLNGHVERIIGKSSVGRDHLLRELRELVGGHVDRTA
jgi:CheY-like chemotaxis protein/anti-sigma regulatory factor (Ser/Thr protein kinase)